MAAADNASGVNKQLLASIVHYLNSASSSASDGVQQSIQGLVSGFGLETADFDAAAASTPLATAVAAGTTEELWSNPVFVKFIESLKGKGYFGEDPPSSTAYLTKFQAAAARFSQRVKGQESATPAQDVEGADAAKAAGNAHLQAGRLEDAVSEYTRAVKLAPTGPSSHVYYCNRAAARLKLGEYAEAAADAQEAVALAPDYVKAHNRLGQAKHQLGEYAQAVSAYERSLELDASSVTAIAGKAAAEACLTAPPDEQAVAPPTMPGMPGMPGGMPGMPGMGGGMPDLGALMSNPAIGQMMQSPQFQQMAANLMSNPAALQQMAGMMGGMMGGGGGGGMDPAAMAQMASMMGGGAPPPPAPPSE